MNGETCRFFSKFPHQITHKKSRICKGNNGKQSPHLNEKENF